MWPAAALQEASSYGLNNYAAPVLSSILLLLMHLSCVGPSDIPGQDSFWSLAHKAYSTQQHHEAQIKADNVARTMTWQKADTQVTHSPAAFGCFQHVVTPLQRAHNI